MSLHGEGSFSISGRNNVFGIVKGQSQFDSFCWSTVSGFGGMSIFEIKNSPYSQICECCIPVIPSRKINEESIPHSIISEKLVDLSEYQVSQTIQWFSRRGHLYCQNHVRLYRAHLCS